MGAVMTEQLQQ